MVGVYKILDKESELMTTNIHHLSAGFNECGTIPKRIDVHLFLIDVHYDTTHQALLPNILAVYCS